jgi:hypothetical protein
MFTSGFEGLQKGRIVKGLGICGKKSPRITREEIVQSIGEGLKFHRN